MNCPVCKNSELVKHELENELQGMFCERCHGYWIQSYQYWRWHDNLHKADARPPDQVMVEQIKPHDSKPGKICPECGHFLLKYSVGHEIDFGLDKCGTCGGIWLDENEWEILKKHGFHKNVHLIFSASWQSEIVKDKIEKNLEDILKKRIGTNTYMELQKIKHWLDAQPQSNELYAYLLHARHYRKTGSKNNRA